MTLPCNRLRFLFFAVLLVGNTAVLFSQNTKKADSLVTELKKFDKKKAALGAAAPVMMDTLRAKILSAIALEFYINDPEKALPYANEQLKVSQKIGYKWGIAKALNIQATVYDNRGDYESALKAYLDAKKVYTQNGNSLDVIDVNNGIGIIYAKKGIYTEALKYMLMALAVAKKENDYLGLVTTYNNLGIIYKKQGKHNEALKYYSDCLALQLKDERQVRLSYTYLNIGNLYSIKKQYKRAINYFNNGLKSALKEQDNISLGNNYCALGNLYAGTADYKKALTNHEVALAIRQKAGDDYGLFNSYLSIGDINLKTGNTDKALEYTQKAAAIAKGGGQIDFLAEVNQQLSKIYAAQGNYKLAYNTHLLYKQFNDSVFNAENHKKLTEQQMNFDFNATQEKRDLLARQALKNQKDIRNITVGILTFIALFIIVLLVRRHKKSTAEKQEMYTKGLAILKKELTIKELEAQSLIIERENTQLKKEYERGEKEKLQEKLDFNRRELASATLYLFQKNEMLSTLKTDINALPIRNVPTEQLSKLKTAINENLYLDADWEKFRLHFEQVHPDFFKDLSNKHPGLTFYEVRLYAYLHLKLSTKEIAGLLNITPESVRKAKMRLNKKLNIT